MVGALRFELRTTAPKTVVLPLHHAPKFATTFSHVSSKRVQKFRNYDVSRHYFVAPPRLELGQPFRTTRFSGSE